MQNDVNVTGTFGVDSFTQTAGSGETSVTGAINSQNNVSIVTTESITGTIISINGTVFLDGGQYFR